MAIAGLRDSRPLLQCVPSSNRLPTRFHFDFHFTAKFLIVSGTPIVVLLATVLLYLVPKLWQDGRNHPNDSAMRHAARKRSRRKWWKLVLFSALVCSLCSAPNAIFFRSSALFLIYPMVSSTVLRSEFARLQSRANIQKLL